jgi:hypothetical protein
MLLRNRLPGIDARPPSAANGFEHLDQKAIGELHWLGAHGVDYVLVGAVAATIRGQPGATGPVAIVAAPYRRNFERLARALSREQARIRLDLGQAETTPARLTAEKLARGGRWTLSARNHDLDIEGSPAGAPSYQELLYEAGRFELAVNVSVDVAAPEHIEHYEHLRRTGAAPEIKITRNSRIEHEN